MQFHVHANNLNVRLVDNRYIIEQKWLYWHYVCFGNSLNELLLQIFDAFEDAIIEIPLIPLTTDLDVRS